MKQLIFIFGFLLYVVELGFSEKNLFSLKGLDNFINVTQMESFEDSWYMHDYKKESNGKLKKINVNIQDADKNENHIFYYNPKGLLVLEESHVYEDSDYVYEYDEKDRLVSFGDFTFSYIDDIERERYFRGSLQYREILDYQKDKMIITVISYAKKYDDEIIENGKRVYEYSFSKGKLTDIKCTSFNKKGMEKKNKNYLKLFYDNERLERTEEYYGEKLRIEQILIYKNDRLVKKEVRFPENIDSNYIAEFSDFDKYGNFLTYNRKSSQGIDVLLSRKIEYR